MNKTLHSSNRMDWETPQALFDALDREFHFDLDAAASKANAKCEKYFTVTEDALKYPWCAVGSIWLNPPYGRQIGKWMQKAYEESRRQSFPVVCLIPARTDTAWWHNYVMKAAEIRLIRGRIKFVGAESGAPFPSAIVVFRKGQSKPRISTYYLPMV